MMDREALAEFLDRLADRYTAQEIIEILEDNGVITVYDLLDLLEEYVVEGKRYFEL